ncbi:MAG: cyclic nucleotide-binding domain-containing protein [Deltaproteobacteria bacterium]|nr:cyclic nucleotide-binding domain-containing protein [Deltaproteobacteria bacterium]
MAVDKAKLKDEAFKLFQKGKFDKALEKYREVLKVDKRDDRSMMKLAECYKRLNKRAEAIAVLTQISDFYARSGFLLKAISTLKMILEIDKSHQSTLDMLAELYSKRGISAPGSAPATSAPPAATSAPGSDLPEIATATDTTEPEPEPDASEVVAADAVETESPEDVSTVSTDTSDLDTGAEPDSADLIEEITPIDEALPEVPLFSDLPPEEFKALIEKCHFRQFKAKTRIIQEGDPGDSFYVLVSGEVLVYRTGEDGKSRKLATIKEGKEGSFFGEFAVLTNSERKASIGALTDVEVLEINKADLDELGAKHPKIMEVLWDFYKKRILANLLLQSPLFQPLSIDDRRSLVSKFTMEKRPKGTVVLKEGTDGDGLYLIQWGEVEIFINDPSGNGEVTISNLSEGSFFGEYSLVKRTVCSASVRTLTDSIFLKLPKAAFNEMIMTHPQILEVIMSFVEQRERETQETKDSLARIASGKK